MDRYLRTSGIGLLCAGLIGLLFFWLTDPRVLTAKHATNDLIERANDARIGTTIGLVGSAVIVGIGIWLTLRKAT